MAPATGLQGPYELTSNSIDRTVSLNKIGAYAVSTSTQDTFTVTYVGRSDSDVAGRLKKYVGTKYKRFKFDYFSTPKAAFEKECGMYHDFNPPDNEIHPDRPENSDWKCPRCKNFG